MLATVKNQARVLLVDRDAAAVEALRRTLSDAGFNVCCITDVGAVAAAMAAPPPHLVIIDWEVSGFAALDVIGQIRAARSSGRSRLIILSRLTAEQDVVTGLELGADDYIFKPYSPRELLARVSTLLRVGGHDGRNQLTAGGLELDHSTSRVMACGRQIDLRGVEYRLLEFLMQHPGRTFSRAELLMGIWSAGYAMDERTVDVNVRRLRKLLAASGCESYLQTVRGFGYRLSIPCPATFHSTLHSQVHFL